jgi:hypothetical protein
MVQVQQVEPMQAMVAVNHQVLQLTHLVMGAAVVQVGTLVLLELVLLEL